KLSVLLCLYLNSVCVSLSPQQPLSPGELREEQLTPVHLQHKPCSLHLCCCFWQLHPPSAASKPWRVEKSSSLQFIFNTNHVPCISVAASGSCILHEAPSSPADAHSALSLRCAVRHCID
ncbi:hypothetical protein JZ751_016165, partial [Albula glossodonta]